MRTQRHRSARIRALGMLAVIGLAVSACGGGAAPQVSATPAAAAASAAATAQAPKLEDSLVILTSGGAFEKAFIKHYYEPFTKATGVKVIPVAANFDTQLAKVKADTEAKNIQWDIIDAGPAVPPDRIPYYMDLGSDCASMPNIVKNGSAGVCRRYNVIRGLGGMVLAYNTKTFGANAPKSWNDFWDVKNFPGTRSLPANESYYILQTALWADGVPLDKIYPLDLDRAFKKLDQIKPNVTNFWTSGDNAQQLWRNGNVVLGGSYSGRAVVLQGEGLPVGITWKGASKDIGGWGILKDAPHPNAAKAFLNFFFAADQDALQRALAFAKDTGYDMPIPAALQLVPEAERAQHAGAPGNWETMIDQDVNWIAANQKTVLERWTAWLTKK